MTETPNPIRSLRQAKNWSLQQLADAVGTTKSQIDKLEKGARRLTVDWMVRLAGPLGCDPRDLMDSSALLSATLSLPLYTIARKGKAYVLGRIERRLACPTGLSASAYAVRVPNDAMGPPFRKGQILYVDPAQAPRKGQAVFIQTRDQRLSISNEKATAPTSLRHPIVGVFNVP